MNDRTLILHLLKGDEITHTSKTTYDVTNNIYRTIDKAINKWHPKKQAENVSRVFRILEQLNVIELTSGNFENGEKHFQIIYKDNILKTLKECILKTTNTEFETIFKNIHLKCERKLKLRKINERNLSI